jgi:ABC-type amino acid transport substrate-binding protein
MPFAKNSSYPEIEKLAAQFETELTLFKESGKYEEILNKWLK